MPYTVTFADATYGDLITLLRKWGSGTNHILAEVEQADYRPTAEEALAFDVGVEAVRVSRSDELRRMKAEQDDLTGFWWKR